MTDNENSTKLPNRGAPKGTRHYSGFDELVDGLLRASLAGRCMLTAGKDRTADELRPIGSLIDLLERLKPYLPNDRMPSNVETLLGAVDRRKAEMHYAELHAWLASEQKIGCQNRD